MEAFNLKKLNDVQVKEQYEVKILNRFAAIQNLDDDVDGNKAWEYIKENINITATESRLL
jgi:heme-degrading monooxygenase HmoA